MQRRGLHGGARASGVRARAAWAVRYARRICLSARTHPILAVHVAAGIQHGRDTLQVAVARGVVDGSHGGALKAGARRQCACACVVRRGRSGRRRTRAHVRHCVALAFRAARMRGVPAAAARQRAQLGRGSTATACAVRGAASMLRRRRAALARSTPLLAKVRPARGLRAPPHEAIARRTYAARLRAQHEARSTSSCKQSEGRRLLSARMRCESASGSASAASGAACERRALRMRCARVAAARHSPRARSSQAAFRRMQPGAASPTSPAAPRRARAERGPRLAGLNSGSSPRIARAKCAPAPRAPRDAPAGCSAGSESRAAVAARRRGALMGTNWSAQQPSALPHSRTALAHAAPSSQAAQLRALLGVARVAPGWRLLRSGRRSSTVPRQTAAAGGDAEAWRAA